MKYHGEEVDEIVHEPMFYSVAAGTSKYTNTTGKTQYIQSLTLTPVGGTPIILVKINGKYWTINQQGTGSGIVMAATALSLGATVSIAAQNEDQEIKLETGSTIEIDYTGGAGSVQVAIILSRGYKEKGN